jgi:hypothetical protein
MPIICEFLTIRSVSLLRIGTIINTMHFLAKEIEDA